MLKVKSCAHAGCIAGLFLQHHQLTFQCCLKHHFLSACATGVERRGGVCQFERGQFLTRSELTLFWAVCVTSTGWAPDGTLHTAITGWAPDATLHTASTGWAPDGTLHTASTGWAPDGTLHTASTGWAPDGTLHSMSTRLPNERAHLHLALLLLVGALLVSELTGATTRQEVSLVQPAAALLPCAHSVGTLHSKFSPPGKGMRHHHKICRGTVLHDRIICVYVRQIPILLTAPGISVVL